MVPNNDFEQQARQAYQQRIASLDSETLHQLRKAREQALAKSHKFRWKSSPGKWLSGAGAGIVLAGMLSFLVVPELMTNDSITPLEDIELLSAEADLDLITDFEFYEWLDESELSDTGNDINS